MEIKRNLWASELLLQRLYLLLMRFIWSDVPEKDKSTARDI